MAADRGQSNRARRGQVVLLVLFAAVALLVAALWLADVHHAVLAKDRTQNAGDAAALAAARWQATALDLEGELNLFHALALASLDHAAVEAVTNAQLRLLFAGPLAGVLAAQQAAKLNGAPSNPGFTAFVRECADTARRGYGARPGGGGETALPELWPGAWEDYADALDAIAAGGVAAGVDNAVFLTDPAGAHWLLDRGFYAAVAGRDWCWFHRNAPGLLDDYDDFRWWPALPDAAEDPAPGSEMLCLHLRPRLATLGGVLSAPAVAEAFCGVATEAPRPGPGTNQLLGAWMCYDPGAWGEWTSMKDPSLPLEGELRPEYDYLGADAAMRVENPFARLTGREGGTAAEPMLWIGAAKPFGHLEGDEGPVPPPACPLVLPVFRVVRLIPLDASSGGGGGGFDLRWRAHRTEHLPRYLARGLSGLEAGCPYCSALARWEDDLLREAGVRWLAENSWKCTVSPPGHGGPGGGSRHAH